MVCFDRVRGLDDVAGYANHRQDCDHDSNPKCGPLKLVPAIESELSPCPWHFVERLDQVLQCFAKVLIVGHIENPVASATSKRVQRLLSFFHQEMLRGYFPRRKQQIHGIQRLFQYFF
jgi:hypothetical protein